MNTESKKKIIIFGASTAGHATFNYMKSQQEYSVIAFSDNDKSKHNSIFCGLDVVDPRSIKLMDVDLVVIGSIFVKEIRESLINHGIDEAKIEVPLRSVLSGHTPPFENESVVNCAGESIIKIFSEFEARKIDCTLGYGTLLGIYRDSQLITWDSDIDLYLFSKDADYHIPAIGSIIDEFNQSSEYQWKYSVAIETKTNHIVEHDLLCTPKDSSISGFNISLTILSPHSIDGKLHDLNSHVPSSFFKEIKQVKFHGGIVKIPGEAESYLELIYGEDWSYPIKECRFDDFNYQFNSSLKMVNYQIIP